MVQMPEQQQTNYYKQGGKGIGYFESTRRSWLICQTVSPINNTTLYILVVIIISELYERIIYNKLSQSTDVFKIMMMLT